MLNGLDSVLRALTVLLLAIIAILQALILTRMPPTIGELRSADAADRRKILMRKPLIDVSGSVEVDNTVSVEVDNSPLEVEIVR
jgi:hypothetical protein